MWLFGVGGLIGAQCLAFFGAVYFSARTLTLLPAVLFVALCAANPDFTVYHYYVMTESLSATLLIVCLTLAIRAWDQCSLRYLLAATFVAGLMMTVRPSGFGLIAIALFAFRMPKRKALAFLLALAVWATPIAVASSALRFWRGENTTSLLGPHLYAKAVLIGPAGDTAAETPLEARLLRTATDTYSPIRTVLRDARGTPAYQHLLGYYENCIQHSCTASQYRDVPEAKLNEAMKNVGVRVIAGRPLEYLGLTVREYIGLWYTKITASEVAASEYNRFMSQHPSLPFERFIGATARRHAYPSNLGAAISMAWGLIGIFATIAGPVAALLYWRFRDPALAPVMIVGAAVLIISASTAATAIGFSRYSVGIWPALALLIVVTLEATRRWLLRPSARDVDIVSGHVDRSGG
ncbi:hypothetical protein [Sphingomonas albertensis]|uniref:hypothetical protein n=1 Tax=Sphingomonas albertensis TaxID=2762591 RepID=UPI0037DA0AC0